MNRQIYIAIVTIMLLFSANAYCQTETVSHEQNSIVNDTIRPRDLWASWIDWNVFIVPIVSYLPETDWAFGAAGAYYFKFKGQSKNSDIGFNGTYTLNKQWNVDLFSSVYFEGDHRWFLYARAGFKRYPDYFYGKGNRTDDLLTKRISYTSNNVYLIAQPQCNIIGNWIVGAHVQANWEKTDTDANLDSIGQFCSVIGLNQQFFMLGLGVLVAYDSRDEQFYPSQGLFFKAVGSYFEPYLGSTYRMGKFAAEFRQFVPIYKDFIFAWQANTEWTFGCEKPIQMLPTLGGMDIVRGVRRGEWRDDAMMALQAEFRIPIWRFLKASVFGSIGDVYNLSHWQWAIPKIGYGAGLRIAINKAKVNVRIDVARQNYGNNWSFYLTMKEAF